MPAVRGNPWETPCVRCGHAPTVGYAHGGTVATSGRICKEHGREAAKTGVAVAADVGGGANWGER